MVWGIMSTKKWQKRAAEKAKKIPKSVLEWTHRTLAGYELLMCTYICLTKTK